ncbi:MAG TPA: type VI secretion system protein TssA [Deltaproteobacteria bacterium]|nr:type VI secretion system protein TssA [Deltaproteobacteria bacterium]
MELLELGRNPINGESPVGADARYEPEYEALQNEIDKLTSPTSQGGINWDTVVQLGTTILAEKSKDLLAASYLGIGLIQTQGAEGLEAGLVIYRDLLENFWDTMFPVKKRMRGRLNALEWWKESITSALKSLSTGRGVITADRILRISETVAAIDNFLAEHVDDAPSLRQLQESIANLQAEGVAEEGALEEPAVADQEERRADTVKPVETETVRRGQSAAVTDADPDKILNNGLDALRHAASLYMMNDPSSPVGYRLIRFAAWFPVKVLPPAQDGKTRIPGPMAEIRNALNNLHQQNEFKSLLESAESRVGQFLFWLDLSRYVAQALEHLNYSDAHQAVVEETAMYVHRLSGIEDLAFSDGLPFADDDTKEWLKEISMKSAGEAESGFTISPSSSDESDEAKIADVAATAQTLIKEKKVAEGVALIQENLTRGLSHKARFLWRIALIRLLVSAKKSRVALPHIWEVLQDIEKHELDTWDPDLVLKALGEVYATLKVQTDKDIQDRAAEALDHIARLNPVAALRLTT